MLVCFSTGMVKVPTAALGDIARVPRLYFQITLCIARQSLDCASVSEKRGYLAT